VKRSWNLEELVEHCTLLPDELNLLTNKTDPSRLGFAVLLKCFQYEGRFPQYKGDIPLAVITHIAQQIHVAPEQFQEYEGHGKDSCKKPTLWKTFLHEDRVCHFNPRLRDSLVDA
jgi:hypothetical protein